MRVLVTGSAGFIGTNLVGRLASQGDEVVAIADHRFCGTVKLGSGRPRLLSEMVEAVFSAMGRSTRLRVVPADPQEVRATCADPAQARVDAPTTMPAGRKAK